MDIFEVINTNRAVRHFKPDPVPQEVLDQILEAAVHAPNGGNSQRWHFVVLRDPEARSTVGELYRQAYIEPYCGR